MLIDISISLGTKGDHFCGVEIRSEVTVFDAYRSWPRGVLRSIGHGS